MNECSNERIEYVICKPGGNDTALVYGKDAITIKEPGIYLVKMNGLIK